MTQDVILVLDWPADDGGSRGSNPGPQLRSTSGINLWDPNALKSACLPLSHDPCLGILQVRLRRPFVFRNPVKNVPFQINKIGRKIKSRFDRVKAERKGRGTEKDKEQERKSERGKKKLEFAAFGVLSHSYKRTPRPSNNMMAVAAAQKNREMFAIKKSYSIERTELDAEKRRWVVPSPETDR
uniref:Uncharacterized protein n=1 Tax=Timema bartmani TaxID=61472 RepID=A0A7R9F5F7_9NEOP|nr:unnamed protein product [Timema bartmani]